MADDSLAVTIVNTNTGQSETLPLGSSTLVSEIQELAKALLGLEGNVQIFRDGKLLTPSASLGACGVKNGDLLVAQVARRATPAPAPAPAAAGGLDFSNLLASAPAAPAAGPGNPVYYPGMNLSEASAHNPHPDNIIKLLQSKEHLFKELNYYSPRLAAKLKGQPFAQAVKIWREEMVKGGIQQAVAKTSKYHEEQTMKKRIHENPEDPEAKEYFAKIKRTGLVQQQYEQMMEEFPEAMGRVLMLYVEAKINGHSIQAFCDSGAQATIMSKKLAEECGLLDLIDTRFEGTAVGVGTGKILGRIHIVQLQIGNYHFPCSLTVMENQDMPFLLGLDMMKRHTCQIDLEKGCLKFRIAPGQYMETPFLHEKDLDQSKGGTKGFDATQANKQIEDAEMKDSEDK